MKSPAQEAFAQAMFWTGIGCLPLSIILIILGALTRKVQQAAALFFLAAMTFTHFVWYFNVLGGALSTKVGRYEPPDWFSFLPFPLVGFIVLTAVWVANDRRRKRAAQPPPLPRQ